MQVSLLNQEFIINMIQSAVESKLRNSNEARTFQEQTLDSSPSTPFKCKKDSNVNPSPSSHVPVNKMVRTDASDPAGRLHAYLQARPVDNLEGSLAARDISSVQELVSDIDGTVIQELHIFGMADDVFALLQYNTHLYLANVVNLSKELMYQQALRRFASFQCHTTDIFSLSCTFDFLQMNTELLKDKAELLEEYFCIYIDSHGDLSRLPVILDQYTPDMDRIPEFVDWEDEKNCFQTIAAAVGNFYAMHPPLLPSPSGDGLQFYRRKPEKNPDDKGKATDIDVEMEDELERELMSEAETAWAQREWSIQHVLFPSMRLFLKPPTSMATNGTFVQVASLEKLYKIFERC
ncbi:DNA mismatch repair protein [Salix suchowensis]|nr:DNA mismatch repair protein [Salix suchowensis]